MHAQPHGRGHTGFSSPRPGRARGRGRGTFNRGRGQGRGGPHPHPASDSRSHFQHQQYGAPSPQMEWSPAYGVSAPIALAQQNNLLVATQFALQQSQAGGFHATPVPYSVPHTSYPTAPYGFMPSQGSSQPHIAPHYGLAYGYSSQAGPSQKPGFRMTAEGYTISESAPQYWDEPAENEDDQPNRKRQRFEDEPQLERHRCEPCRRDFRSQHELSIHQRQHTKCSEPGCKFEGTSKVVEIHEEDRHLRFKAGKRPEPTKRDGPANATIQGLGIALTDPQQISKWLEERKRRWPSQANVDDKEKRRLERVAAGLEPDRRPIRSATERGRGRGAARGRGGPSYHVPPQTLKTSATAPQHQAGLPSDSGSTSDDTDTDGPPEMAVFAPQSALEAPIGASQYPASRESEDTNSDDTSSSSGDSLPDAVSSKIPVTPLGDERQADVDETQDRVKIQRLCKYWTRGKCKGSESCRYLHTKPERGAQPARTRLADPVPVSSPPDLMSKLLSNDIAHEISDLLQVVHFLAENDWLDDVELRPGEADERFITVLPHRPSADAPADQPEGIAGPSQL